MSDAPMPPDPISLSEHYDMVAIPLGDRGAFTLACKRCGCLITDGQTHDAWHGAHDA